MKRTKQTIPLVLFPSECPALFVLHTTCEILWLMRPPGEVAPRTKFSIVFTEIFPGKENTVFYRSIRLTVISISDHCHKRRWVSKFHLDPLYPLAAEKLRLKRARTMLCRCRHVDRMRDQVRQVRQRRFSHLLMHGIASHQRNYSSLFCIEAMSLSLTTRFLNTRRKNYELSGLTMSSD